MPRIKYVEMKFTPGRLALIAQANEIVQEYSRQGFDLTLRQLYYQFVSRGYIANKQQEYKRLGEAINDARLAGMIDWHAITDRTRNLRGLAHWDEPSEIVADAAAQFRVDRWKTQRYRVEVWIEKDALVGVIDGVCRELDVPYFSCRGYTSQSEMWAASQRLISWRKGGQQPVILHLGDHDPSGIDMSRDIEGRLRLFMGGEAPTFKRLALNMPQVEQYKPPPNPAKTTDSRYEGYIAKHGDESWELDALEPTVIAALIRDASAPFISKPKWKASAAAEAGLRKQLTAASSRWSQVTEFLAREEDL